MTLNEINAIFTDIATKHLQLNGFLIVQDFDINPQEDLKYPCLAINPTNASLPKSDNGYTLFSIDYTLKVFDLVDKGLENENDVLSDTLEIIKDVVTELNQHPNFWELNLEIISDVSIEGLRGAFDEDVTGWQTTLTLQAPNVKKYCNLPTEAL